MATIFTRDGLRHDHTADCIHALLADEPPPLQFDDPLPPLAVIRACAACTHLGFSHDNWDECAECGCEQYVIPLT